MHGGDRFARSLTGAAARHCAAARGGSCRSALMAVMDQAVLAERRETVGRYVGIVCRFIQSFRLLPLPWDHPGASESEKERENFSHFLAANPCILWPLLNTGGWDRQ